MKVIKSLENRGTTRKITIQAGGFLNWFTINEKCTYNSS